MPNKIDRTGERHGKLLVLYDTEKRTKTGKNVIWHCICDCGRQCDVPSIKLSTGAAKSCGCLRKRPIKDLTNKRFGKLIAIRPTEERKNNSVVWECKCDCGNICYKSSRDLVNNFTVSCGCLKQSQGQLKIEQLLIKNNIKYKKEYSFKNLKSKNNGSLRFDFAIFNDNNELSHLIQFDGQQHFKEYNNDWFKQSSFKKIQESDLLKNNYCKQNNLILIRIPFSYLSKIKIEDLTINSKFVII